MDASWADTPNTRKSQTSYLCTVFGRLVSWNSCKQRNITWSSTAAELNALVDAYHEATWIKALVNEIFNLPLKAIPLNIDNSGLDNKIRKFGSNSKTQHLDLKTKGMRDEIGARRIELKLIKSSQMLADALTKACSVQSIALLFSFLHSNIS